MKASLVEQMAKDLCKRRPAFYGWADLDRRGKDVYRDLARAALDSLGQWLVAQDGRPKAKAAK